MTLGKPVEPVTLDYAPVRNARRWCVIDIALVTLAILILFAFAANCTVRRFMSTTPSDSISLARAKLDSLGSTFALYHLHLGAYPTSLDDLLNAPEGEASARWRGPYVEEWQGPPPRTARLAPSRTPKTRKQSRDSPT